MFYCSKKAHRYNNNNIGCAWRGEILNLRSIDINIGCLAFVFIRTSDGFSFFIFILQNWVSFGKVAHDLVMRIQKIDGDNYPEVLTTIGS